jgi:cytochrome bd-type quinol oxidase subunit 2
MLLPRFFVRAALPIFFLLVLVSASPVCAQQGVEGGASTTINFAPTLSSTTIEGAAGTVLSTIRAVIVVLAIVFLVIGAVLYVTSAGNEGRMTLAKGAVTASMIGLALGLAAPSFLKEIGAALGWTNTDAALTAGGVLTLSEITRKVLDFFLSIVGILSVIMLVVGGSTYLTSAGDEGRAETAKSIVKWAIVGIAVTFASLTIVTQVATLLV